ncbi:membrane progestin receptor gamma isoform X2 [Patagioenas fasciata]|uniref:membrane progestin receptor gamma isoform X2 n=1 Tax=Patagioenas fasciata TaxID=372321 RepID=UPI003A9A06B6
MLSLKLPRLLSIHQVPKGYREQGILFGYRPPQSSATDCLLSAFQMTNETLNIWTHFVPAWVRAGILGVHFPHGMGQQHLPPLLRPHRRVQHCHQHQPVLLFQVSGGGAAWAQQGIPHPGLCLPVPLRQHPSLLQAVHVRSTEVHRRCHPAALQTHRFGLPHLLHLRQPPARATRTRTLRLHRAQPPSFPRLRDCRHALPAGGHPDRHGGAAGPAPAPLAAALGPADAGLHGRLRSRQPGCHRALLPGPALPDRASAQRKTTRPLGFGSREYSCCSTRDTRNFEGMV